ncbi:hypothetical protein J3D55_003749 [Chryseobacterium ginsenosidimutans]|uniref:hypothetical protein n=1 Tax=Chryseobacterium ginsenosidimutans TaxID=687846 RepID=UPI00216A2E3B|nr:hypothetical protein [Chryseobacterium ginsenosidimutans]MCS3870833.1 hypothetical protein [Chryseobacterium ginsenosidimutans]
MMKHIFEFVLATIIIYFVWNILKRIFFKTFHSYVFGNKNNNRQNPDVQNSNKISKKINWDAETVDYEEVKETKDKR